MIFSSPTLASRLLFAQMCMLFNYKKNYWTVILSDVDDVGGLQFLRNSGQLKLLSQIMKILEISTVLIDCVSNIFVSQRITVSWFFSYGFQSVWFSWEKICDAEYIIKNLLLGSFLNYFKKFSAWNFCSKLLFSKDLNLTFDHDEKRINLSFGINALSWSKDTFL